MTKKDKGREIGKSFQIDFGDKAHTSTNQRLCHMGPKLVFEVKGLEVYGGSIREAETYYREFDLVISAGERLRMEGAKGLTNSILKSINLIRLIREYCPENLYLEWRDFGVPTYPLPFWKKLVEVLKKKGRDRERRGKKYKVLVHCMGGHGRTGTTLSILAALASNWVEEEPRVDIIEKVRRVYCHHAVETYRQVEYVEEITGLRSRVEVKARGVNTTNFTASKASKIESLFYNGEGTISKHSFTDPKPSSKEPSHKEVESGLRNLEKVEKRGKKVNVIYGGVARLEGESVEDWRERARKTRADELAAKIDKDNERGFSD